MIKSLAIPEVKLVQPKRFEDDRGYFSETYNFKLLSDAGVDCVFVQDNQSLSRAAGTLRGLHFQLPPHVQSKLVRCTAGRIFDCAVDLRAGSATFGQSVCAELSAENGAQLFIPAGFAHGFLTLEPNSIVQYKVDAYYAPEFEAGLTWDDPDLSIDWPIGAMNVILSEKDCQLPCLKDIQAFSSDMQAVSGAGGE